MDETFLRNVTRLGNKFKGTELGGAHTGLAGEDEEEEVRVRGSEFGQCQTGGAWSDEYSSVLRSSWTNSYSSSS